MAYSFNSLGQIIVKVKRNFNLVLKPISFLIIIITIRKDLFFNHILSLKVLIALLLFFGMISLLIGVISINVKDILNLNSTQLEIITLTRIPRLITILLTRMSLSICGLIMQQLTQNKFISPTTAGTMDCAKFGILISLIFFAGASFFTQAVIASVFALLGSFIFIQILRKIKLKDVIFAPLIGLMIVSVGIIYDVLGINAIDENIKVGTHGKSINSEFILEKNPDYIFVVDRNIIVGNKERAQGILDNALVAKTKTAQNKKIIYLDPEYWYLASGNGLESLKTMILEIKNAVK